MSIIQPNASKVHDYFATDHSLAEIKSLAKKGTGASVSAQTLNFGIQVIHTVILSRILTPDDFGLVAMVIVISLLLANFGGNGFIEAIIQEQKIDHGQISTLFWINTGISGVLTVLFISLAPVLAVLYNDQRIVSITVVSGLLIISTGLATQPLGLMSRGMQFQSIAANTIVGVTVSTLISIGMAFLGFGYWSLVARHVSYPAAITIGAWLLCKWRPGYPENYSQVKSMVKFALNVYGNFCLSYLSRNLDKVLLGKFHGSIQLGHYDRATQLSGMFHNQLTLPVANVAIATMSRFRSDAATCLKYYVKILSVIAFIGMPLSGICTLVGQDCILVVIGSQWTVAGRVFTVIAPSIGMLLLYSTHIWLHYSMGRADRLLRWSILGTVVSVLLLLVGLKFGAIGVASAYSVSYFVLIVPGLLYAGRPINLKASHILQAVWRCFAAALFAGLACFYVFSGTFLFEMVSQLNIVIRIALTSFCCLTFYLIILVSLYRSFSPVLGFIYVLRDMVPGYCGVRGDSENVGPLEEVEKKAPDGTKSR